MKITAPTTMLLLLMGVALYGQPEALREPTICLEGDAAGFSTVFRAQNNASLMFAGIGVTIHWKQGLRDCPVNAIRMSLNRNPQDIQKPGALAYALPYEGMHIQVFYDRISSKWEPDMAAIVLAHVMVHEITHILQGISRHSSQGIMKAHWSDQEYFQMRCKLLEFTREDIDLIYRGLASRAHTTLAAMSTLPPEVPAAR